MLKGLKQNDYLYSHVYLHSCQSMDRYYHYRPVGDGQWGSQHSGLRSSSTANPWRRKETPLYPQNSTAKDWIYSNPVFTYSYTERTWCFFVLRWSSLSSVWLVGGEQSLERCVFAARIVGWWPTQSAVTAAPCPVIPSLLALLWRQQRCWAIFCLFSTP